MVLAFFQSGVDSQRNELLDGLVVDQDLTEIRPSLLMGYTINHHAADLKPNPVSTGLHPLIHCLCDPEVLSNQNPLMDDHRRYQWLKLLQYLMQGVKLHQHTRVAFKKRSLLFFVDFHAKPMLLDATRLASDHGSV